MFRNQLVIAGLTLLSLSAIAEETGSNAPVNGVRYIIQANSLGVARSAVLEAGGEITHELKIINAVRALLSPRQYNELAADTRLEIQRDRAAGISAAEWDGDGDELCRAIKTSPGELAEDGHIRAVESIEDVAEALA